MAKKHDPEKEFEDIIQEALRKADRVVCDIATYRSGLRTMIAEIQTAIRASEECEGRTDED